MPAAVVGVAGLLLMYLARAQWFVMVAGIVMMAGGMVVSACCHGLIRDYTPEGKAVDNARNVEAITRLLSR